MNSKINSLGNIEVKIEYFRYLLNDLIQKNPHNYLKTEIIQVSTQLDELIVKYMRTDNCSLGMKKSMY